MRYSLGFAKAAPATLTGVAMIRPASTLDVSVLEIGIFNETAVASSIGLVRNATTGTPSTSALVQAAIPGANAGNTNIDTAWSAAATVGANYMRQVVLPASIGAGVIWTWPPNVLIARAGATTQLMLWNFGAGTAAALRCYIDLDE
jgi:hypothetical protein